MLLGALKACLFGTDDGDSRLVEPRGKSTIQTLLKAV